MLASMDADLLDLARTVDLTVLGARVKQARVAKRLTQTEVAGAEMSTAYVSRIESGQRRPDPELLSVIATRVGVGLDELVMGTTRDKVNEARLGLIAAEVELRTGDSAGALGRVNETLMDLAGHGQIDLQREALRIKAGALEASGRLDEAIILLEDLTEGTEHDTQWLRDVTRLCRCYRVTGDLNRAVETGESALRTLKDYDLGGTGEASALTLSLAAAYFERGETGAASRLCQRAIDQAERLGSSTIGETYWAASIMESRRGRHEAALQLGRKALAYIEMGENHRLLATVRSQLGILQLRGENPEPAAALHTLENAAREMVATDAGTSVRAMNLVAQARAHLFLGNLSLAREKAAQARSVAAATSPIVTADSLLLEGQTFMRERRTAEARSLYLDAVGHLSAVGADRSAAQLWFELGERFEDTGDSASALDAFKRSAASSGVTAINAALPNAEEASTEVASLEANA